MIRPDDGAPGPNQAQTPKDVLLEALERTESLPEHTRCVVLFINDAPGTYDVRYNFGNITCSQVALACAYIQALMLRVILNDRPEHVD